MPSTEAVNNSNLLEIEITRVLDDDGWHVGKNDVGDPCLSPNENKGRELNIAKLAQALSPTVLVKITPHLVKID